MSWPATKSVVTDAMSATNNTLSMLLPIMLAMPMFGCLGWMAATVIQVRARSARLFAIFLILQRYYLLIVKEPNPTKLAEFEGEQLEYKREVDKRKLAREMVAFANTSGGKIKIGVDDDGTVVGVRGITADTVSNIARDCCEPHLTPNPKVDREVYDGKEVVVVAVDPGLDPPYRTKSGMYYKRVGATIRIASLSELIDLIIKGSHRGTILHKARMPQLWTQISASMKANAGFDQALTGIAELFELAMNTTDESTKLEVVGMVDKLLKISCSDSRVIQSLLSRLALLVPINLAQNISAQPPSQEFVGRVIEILKRVLFTETVDPSVTERTEYVLRALYLVGLGCIWAKYDDQVHEVFDALKSNCGRDRKLTKLCNDTVGNLAKCAEEEPTYQPRRIGMLFEPLLDRRDRTLASILRGLF